jgi:hypothetical protein
MKAAEVYPVRVGATDDRLRTFQERDPRPLRGRQILLSFGAGFAKHPGRDRGRHHVIVAHEVTNV